MSLRRIVFCFAACAVVAIAGCGGDSSVVFVPDTTPPLPPQIVGAVTKDASRAVLSWLPNSESDLAGYNVYEMSPARKLNTSLIHQSMFSARVQGGGIHLYRVTAVDRSGNESAPSDRLRLLPVPSGPGGGDQGGPGDQGDQSSGN